MKGLFTTLIICTSLSAFCQTWIGNTSSDWNEPLNWSSSVPTSTSNVTIPSGTTYPPVIATSPAAACRNLDIQSGSTLTISTGGVLQLYRNLTVAGTFTHTAGTLELDGDTPQVIDGITAYDIRINNDSGVVLNGNLIVNDSLVLINGAVTTGAYIVDMHDTTSGKLAGGDSTSYINGTLRRAVYDTGLYQFPVGSGTRYQLAEVHFNTNPGKQSQGIDSLTAFYVSGNGGCTGISGTGGPVVNGTTLTDLLDGGYWTIHPDTTIYSNVNYDITLHEKGATNVPLNPQSCAVVKRARCDSAWASLGTHNNNTQSFIDTTLTAKRSQLISFSDFGIGFGNGGATGLPVEVINLKAGAVNNSYIQVSWTTTIEINNLGFEVQRSEDAQTWSPIGWVNGNGNSSQQINYTFNDINAAFNVSYYYRLKQTDFNNNYRYVNMAMAMLQSNTPIAISEFAPNPAVATANLTIAVLLNQNIGVDLYNMLGQKVSSAKYALNAGAGNKIQFNTQNLATGSYTAVIITNTGAYTRRLHVTN